MISERILQKNLRALAKEHPEIARKIEQAELPSGWHVFEARNGMPTLEVEHEGKRLSVHSRYDPEKEAISWCKAIADDWDVLVIFGFGLGYHYEAIVSLNPGKDIILVENSLSHLKAALASKDLTKSIRQHGLRVVASSDPMWNSSEIMLNHMGKKIAFKALPAYENIFGDFWCTFQHNATNLVRQHRGNIATMERFKQQWLENYVENVLTYIQSRPVKDFFNRFNNRPAIIVAAGPSLENNVHMLKELRDRALIIAAGSAIRVLERNGVRPHLLVSFDGSEANYRHFEDFNAGDLPLAFAPIIYPRIIQEYKGPLIGFELDITPFVHWFDQKIEWDPGMIVCGPSVANLCLDLAKKMGSNPITFVGQDLAFTNLKTHADGAKHQRVIEPEGKDYIVVEDVFGNEVLTNSGFYNMKTWFERQLRLDKGERLVIDASEGGARIAGTEILTLQQVAERYLKERFYPQVLIGEIIHSPVQYNRVGYTTKLKEVVEDIMRQHEVIEEHCRRGLAYAEELNSMAQKGRVSDGTFTKGLREFRKLDGKITTLDYFQVFLKENVAPRFQAINLVLGKRMQEEQDHKLKLARLAELYSAFFRQTQGFAKMVHKCLMDMRTGMDETTL